jgi:hypothetical protein
LIEGRPPNSLKVGLLLSAMRVKVYCARAAGAAARNVRRAAKRVESSFDGGGESG